MIEYAAQDTIYFCFFLVLKLNLWSFINPCFTDHHDIRLSHPKFQIEINSILTKQMFLMQ